MSKCKKCENLRATTGWFGYVQISEINSGKLVVSPYEDRLLNPEFYPLDSTAEGVLDCWPVCPDCQKPLQPDGNFSDLQTADSMDITPVMLALGILFLGILFLLIL